MAWAFNPTRWRWWAAASLPLLVMLAYWPGLGGGFAFDDFPNIVDNTALHVSGWDWRAWSAAAFSSEAGTLQRPLAMLSFALNHAFTGLDPMPMKATNIAIHALNGLLALVLARRLAHLAHPGQAVGTVSAFAATSWALHPINATAVLLVVQRMESLSHTVVLAGLWMYLHGRSRQLAGQRGWRCILGGLVGGTALGSLAKESAALLPVYALLAEGCLLGFRGANGGRQPGLGWLYTIFLLLPALIGTAWLWPKVSHAYAFRDFSLSERLLTEGRVVMDYLNWTLAPDLRSFGLYHDDYVVSRGWLAPASTVAAFAAIAGLLLLAGWLRRRRPLVALGILWFFAAQLLTATVLPLELVYEHRNYFASFGICLAVADLLLVGAGVRTARATAAVLALGFLFGTTLLRAREWSDPYRFAKTEAAKHPESPRATYALGQMMVMVTGYDRESPALPAAFDALEHARSVPGSGLLPDSALLLLAAHTGYPLREEWWAEMEGRLLVRRPGPQDTNALMSLTRCARDGDCRFPAGKLPRLYAAALASGPNADVLTMAGDYALNVEGKPDVALQAWTKAVSLQPRVPQYRINLVKLLIHLHRDDEARAQIAALREIGTLGRNELAARELEQQFARRAPAPTMNRSKP